jgi:hypothetical protein
LDDFDRERAQDDAVGAKYAGKAKRKGKKAASKARAGNFRNICYRFLSTVY